ncbi:DUF4062 domain-containing protein [Agrobacterium sp. DKPNP3]|uniref:DUF4062 domain-containing protein n=1 Tax=Agrobacterium sp. DKPNP3 TaxID=3457323 RepID=UPI0040443B3F
MKKKLQVFVSSTFTDLQTERQAAVQAILKAGHIPAGMELFTASDKSQWEIIKRWIDESDVYMLILGGRYGSVDKDTGISYTEMEYDYAVEKRKPLFSVVIKEDALEAKVKNFGSSVIEQDNPKALKKFREKVLSTMSAFFVDDRDIKLAIHESLGELGHQTDLVGWVSASEIVDVSALHAEISRLRSELDSATSSKGNSITSRRTTTKSDELDDIIELLSATTIEIPDAIEALSGTERSLAELVSHFYSQLVNGVPHGVTNPTSRFLIQDVFPKLIIHGLAETQKPTANTTRRSVLTERGLRVLAQLERNRIMGSGKNSN